MRRCGSLLAFFAFFLISTAFAAIPCPYLLKDAGYGEVFRSDLNAVLADHVPRINALVESGIWRPERKSTYEELGFSFVEGNIKVPGPAEFLTNYERIAEKRGIPRESRLLPVRIFRDAKENLRVLKPHRLAPKEWKPDNGAISHPEFVRLVQNGFFPLFEPSIPRNKVIYSTRTWHDIGHLVGWLEFPNYARAFRKAVLKLANVSPDLLEFKAPLGRRLNFVLEWMSFPRMNRTDLMAALKVPSELYSKPQVTVAEVEKWLASDPERAKVLNESFLRRWPTIVDFYGGAIDDGMVYRFKTTAPTRFEATFERKAGGYSGLLEEFLQYQDDPKGRVSRLASLYTYLIQISQTTPATLVEEALKLEVDRSSSFYKLYCASGIVTSPQFLELWGCR